MLTMGSRIRQLRISCGLTQGQLGKLLGVSGQAVSDWETLPEPKISLGNVDALCAAFGVNADCLKGSDAAPPRAWELHNWLPVLVDRLRQAGDLHPTLVLPTIAELVCGERVMQQDVFCRRLRLSWEDATAGLTLLSESQLQALHQLLGLPTTYLVTGRVAFLPERPLTEADRLWHDLITQGGIDPAIARDFLPEMAARQAARTNQETRKGRAP